MQPDIIANQTASKKAAKKANYKFNAKSAGKLPEQEIMSPATAKQLKQSFANYDGNHHESVFWQKAHQTRNDAQVMACMQQRIYHAVALPYRLYPADDTPQAQNIASFVAENLKRLDLERITEQMLWSRFYGYAIAEIIWGRRQNHIVIESIKPRHPQYFDFDDEGNLYLKNAYGKKTPLPAKKFWHVSSGGICADQPKGEALCQWLYAPVKIKHDCMEQWQLFLEKYASPTIIGKYPAARVRESEKQALLDAAANLRRDTAAVIPDSMMLELLEANRTGNGEYNPLIAYCQASIAKLILGQTMTTDQGSSYSQANVHDRVRERLITADCDLISESFTRQVIAWLCEWNFGQDAPIPHFYRGYGNSTTDPSTNQTT